ncbi:hypothetical protein GG344DRAFT_83591, partial [Lentinula edodes]
MVLNLIGTPGNASKTSTISRKRKRHDEQSEVQESGDCPEKRAKTIKRTPKKKAVQRRKVPKWFKGVHGVFALLQRLWNFTIYNWHILSHELYPFTSLQILSQEKIKVKDHNTTIINYKAALKLKAQYVALKSEEDRRAWIKQKFRERRAINNHARFCEAWHLNHLEQRSRHLNDIRNQRLQAILTRLELIGLRRDADMILLGESDFNISDDLLNLHSVKQAKVLTDRGWAHMESELVGLLSEHKEKRLEREHNESCRKRYLYLKQEYTDILSHRDLREPYPGVGEILFDPVFKAMVWDTATEEELMPAFVRSRLMEHLPRIAGVWRPSKIQEILQILRNVRPSATLSDLDLAVTIFGCARCNVLMSSSQVFYHPCCYINRIIDDVGHHRMRMLNEHYNTEQDSSWSSHSLFFNGESSRSAETILIGTGLDPSTATTGDLTRAHPVIECSGPQEDAFPGRLFMTWPAALMYNQRIGEEIFFIINRFGQETSRIRIQEPLGIFSDVICCAHCHEKIAVAALFHHLISWLVSKSSSSSPPLVPPLPFSLLPIPPQHSASSDHDHEHVFPDSPTTSTDEDDNTDIKENEIEPDEQPNYLLIPFNSVDTPPSSFPPNTTVSDKSPITPSTTTAPVTNSKAKASRGGRGRGRGRGRARTRGMRVAVPLEADRPPASGIDEVGTLGVNIEIPPSKEDAMDIEVNVDDATARNFKSKLTKVAAFKNETLEPEEGTVMRWLQATTQYSSLRIP